MWLFAFPQFIYKRGGRPLTNPAQKMRRALEVAVDIEDIPGITEIMIFSTHCF